MIKVVREGQTDGVTNMRRDVALFEAAETGTAGGRVYEWDGPWVSLGKFQSVERALLPHSEVCWVMRPTGGKAVLHGHDVTIGLAVPLATIGVEDNRSLGPAYRAVVRIIVAALRDCGADAALGEDTAFVGTKGKTADCFAHVAPNDIVNRQTGQKVCGCALKLGAKSVLVQASVPVRAPLVDPCTVFANPAVSTWTCVDADELASALGVRTLDRPQELLDSVQ